jgi:hypothetical protein
VEQSLNNIQAYNNYAIPNENIVLVATTDTVIVNYGLDFYGSNYQFEVQFANLGEWAEVFGSFTDEFNFNYEFWSYFESIIDDNAPVITADADVIEIVLPWGTCDTIVNWDVILNPINAFGAGSNYVTNQHNGSFYAAINGGAGLTTLGVDGNSGADGSGSLEQLSYPITSANGDQYTVYTAIFDGNGDPWIYPMWIVPASEDQVTTSVDEDLSDSRFVLENLSGTPQPYFYYLFASKSNEAPYELSSLQSVSQLLVDGFSPYLNNGTLDLESLSVSMNEIMDGIQDSVLNDGKYYTINIDGSVEWNLNDQPVGINDGGNDIYDGGNFLLSNFNDYYAEGEESTGIPYTNGAVVLGGPSEGQSCLHFL